MEILKGVIRRGHTLRHLHIYSSDDMKAKFNNLLHIPGPHIRYEMLQIANVTPSAELAIIILLQVEWSEFT